LSSRTEGPLPEPVRFVEFDAVLIIAEIEDRPRRQERLVAVAIEEAL
jgi:hypothetical protein